VTTLRVVSPDSSKVVDVVVVPIVCGDESKVAMMGVERGERLNFQEVGEVTMMTI
jgi:hypothetical protein